MSKNFSYLNDENNYLLDIPTGTSIIVPANNYDLEMTYIVGNDTRDLTGNTKLDFASSLSHSSYSEASMSSKLMKILYWSILLCVLLFFLNKINRH